MTPPGAPPLHVLLLSPDASAARTVAPLLERGGMKAQFCADVEPARAALAAALDGPRPFRLVVLDCRRPGCDLAPWARRLREAAPVPFLWLAGEAACQETMPTDVGIAAVVMGARMEEDLLPAARRAISSPAPAANGLLPRRASGAEAPPAPSVRKMKILLAEDHEINQRLAVTMLGKRGHSVTVAPTGRHAVAAAQREPYDLVLMDLHMPEMDGFEATAAIRRAEVGTGRRVPIVALTASALAGDDKRCLDVGMDDFLMKPIRAATLYECVERWAAMDPKSSHPTQPASFDPAAALEMVGGDEVLLREISALLETESRAHLRTLREAAAKKDADAVSFAAHALKGSVVVLRAPAATEAALAVEQMGRSRSLDGLDPALDRLEREVDRLVRDFARFVAAKGS